MRLFEPLSKEGVLDIFKEIDDYLVLRKCGERFSVYLNGEYANLLRGRESRIWDLKFGIDKNDFSLDKAIANTEIILGVRIDITNNPHRSFRNSKSKKILSLQYLDIYVITPP